MTKTSFQREQAFRQELAALLAKHGAELEITFDTDRFDGVALVTMKIQEDASGNTVAEHTEFEI